MDLQKSRKNTKNALYKKIKIFSNYNCNVSLLEFGLYLQRLDMYKLKMCIVNDLSTGISFQPYTSDSYCRYWLFSFSILSSRLKQNISKSNINYQHCMNNNLLQYLQHKMKYTFFTLKSLQKVSFNFCKTAERIKSNICRCRNNAQWYTHEDVFINI